MLTWDLYIKTIEELKGCVEEISLKRSDISLSNQLCGLLLHNPGATCIETVNILHNKV